MSSIVPARSKLFSAVLASLMQDRGVNQTQLSQRAGLAVSRVNNYLQGKYRTITPAHLEVIFGLGRHAGRQRGLGSSLPIRPIAGGMPRAGGDPRSRRQGNRPVESAVEGSAKDFAAALRDLYVLCVSSVKVRQRTAGWVKIMRETKG